ncbi:hypothetical protein KR222_009584 [Zaprionus bogoriensis]|nr:hypothetical protein KR222_009584 [Zaprionus bogoriensis]
MGYKENFPQMMREAGFKLRQFRDGPLDWRLMGSYETDRILREQNLELVDDALQHLSEAPLGTVLDTHVLDSGIAKYFAMSQFAIQYLLYCRTHLDEGVGELREAHATAQQEIARLRKALAEASNEIVQLHKKITQIEAIREVVYPCHLCPKNFISNEALNIHIGRKHRVGTPTTGGGGGSVGKERDNDMQLINTIKMELEIKQLKERLNAAERNIKERSGSSCRQPIAASPRQDRATATLEVRTVGIQSNLAEHKERDELGSEAPECESESRERKAQLHGLAERLSLFEAWQAQLKQSNEQFIRDINHRLEELTQALELSKQRAEPQQPVATAEERVATPCLEDLERILTEKVAEIGTVSANKLDQVVHHLEMGYKDKLEALERQLKLLSARKEPADVAQQSSSHSKIPKPVTGSESSNLEHIKRQVETQFVKLKRDDDTYSIEEALPQPAQQREQQPKQSPGQVLELSSRSSSGSHPTFTKPPAAPAKLKPKPLESHAPELPPPSSSGSQPAKARPKDLQEATDASENHALTPTSTSRRAAQKPPPAPALPLTRRDARKLVNLRLNPHGYSMKSKSIASTTLGRAQAELTQQRNKFRLANPRFYATRNRIRKFVEKLCSAKLPERAQVHLKSPLPSTGVSTAGSAEEEEDDEEEQEGEQVAEATERTSLSQDEAEDATPTSEESHSSSSAQQQQKHRNFKAQLEQMLAKPAARLASRPGTAALQMSAAKPVPLPRKRVMFNTLDSGRSNDRDNDESR